MKHLATRRPGPGARRSLHGIEADPVQATDDLWFPPVPIIAPEHQPARRVERGRAPTPVNESLTARALAALPPSNVPFLDIESELIRYPKRRPVWALWFVSLALGWFGVDRFLTGRYTTGALKLLTVGGLGLWWAADLFSITAGQVTDRRGVRYSSPRVAALAATAASFLAVGLFAGLAAPPLEPVAHELVRKVQDHVAPAPPAPPTWKPVLPDTTGSGNGGSATFTTHGGRIQVGAQSTGLAYFWVEPDDKDETRDGSKPAVSFPSGGASTTTLELPPGTYKVAVVAEGASKWMAFATELTPAAK